MSQINTVLPVPVVLATGQKMNPVTGVYSAVVNLALDNSDQVFNNTVTKNEVYYFAAGVSLTLTTTDSLVAYPALSGANPVEGYQYATVANLANIVWFFGYKVPSITECSKWDGTPVVLNRNVFSADHTVFNIAEVKDGLMSNIKTVKIKVID